MSICSDCAANPHLKSKINVEGIEGECSICNRQQPKVFSAIKVAEVLEPVIRTNFIPSTGGYFGGGGDELSPDELKYVELKAVIEGILDQEISFSDEIIKIYAGAKFGQEFFHADALYAPVPRNRSPDSRQYLTTEWREILNELRYSRRFFSELASDFFGKIFADIENISSLNSNTSQCEPVIREEPAGFKLFRGRIVDEADFQKVMSDPYLHVGPPPATKARTGRMNAEGVIALYCAEDKDTAIAELRPSIGQTSAVIELHLSRSLRLLDFTRLEKALDDAWPSLLDPRFDKKADVREFLRKLHRRISRPVVPGKESRYLITQTMAEYLAHVRKPGFDGIVFGSSQYEKGRNVVLFGLPHVYDDRREFDVNYIPKSLTFHGTSRVEYKHYDATSYVNEQIQFGDLVLEVEGYL